MPAFDLIRCNLLADRTLGKLYFDNVYICDTLEDTDRHLENLTTKKVYSQTAIPRGTYSMSLVYWEKHANYYPLLKSVPRFSGIMIHGGSSPKDTLGCILVGKLTVYNTLTDCAPAMTKIREIFKNNGSVLQIKVV